MWTVRRDDEPWHYDALSAYLAKGRCGTVAVGDEEYEWYFGAFDGAHRRHYELCVNGDPTRCDEVLLPAALRAFDPGREYVAEAVEAMHDDPSQGGLPPWYHLGCSGDDTCGCKPANM